MNTAVNVNVVHESEAQRQHARVRIPAKLRFIDAQRQAHDVKVDDLSAGGLSFHTKQQLAVGDALRGRLMFTVDNLGLSMDIEFQVRSYHPDSGRTGAQFQNLEPRDIATLRHIITSHLSGELITAGDVLSTLQRDNFTKARKQKDGGSGLSPFGRLKAVTVTLGVFVVGIAAFGFVAKSLYGMYFISHAEAGVVAVPTTNVTMPRDGTVNSLVESGGQVAKGAPLASFTTSMLDMLKGNLDDTQLEPAKIEELFGKQLSGTLTSPCDCVVARQLVDDGQYAAKGQPIFQLIPRTTNPMVEARFSYRQFDEVKPGTRVNFQVAGEDEVRTGQIVSSASLNSEDLASDIRVQIKPDSGLPAELAGRPAAVNSDRGPSLNWLIDKAVARGL
ncbi:MULTISPECIES: PilZ domain-containing protein [Pseudomonas]|uniref:HlyD family efflux transporter periplasmic adaptor subunit n=1 Tax=Pseudomonas juntendi TaxID=2666183 RepID=A0A7W2KKG7_9PSED|nr:MULTISPECIES: PilZ domain-containing protein [Pseudomonas]NOY04917.1 HlyD family efflux transporter periplasmic adaptor subunit [Gammaproteobacteria bacterium]OAK58302.1 hemolysin D [Pseudomonas putida]PPB13544.1 alginate biosynthesis protein Alg44 [Pseudomonas aeruginosa]MBA6100085.1 HlyD family efflux transporter periplasmic adaptor subunit [Pseudomonas juntendi]MBA6143096.1 HlyD family efflux transporter periplasmic adaptor subunit [Pseudomonas juntendi]